MCLTPSNEQVYFWIPPAMKTWYPNYTVARLAEVRLARDYIWWQHPQHSDRLLLFSECYTQAKRMCFHHNFLHI
jgi:hypothetical protein